MQVKANILWNLFGTVFPLSVGIAIIPSLIDALGVSRFGILLLAWTVVSYFGLFDLGLGRAMTLLIARQVGQGKKQEIPSIVQGGLIAILILGFVSGLATAILSPWLVNSMLSIPEHLRTETLKSFYLLATSIPFVILTTGCRGILEGLHRFDIVNMIKAPLEALTYLGPFLVLNYSNTLPPVIALGRIASSITYIIITFYLYPEFAQRSRLHLDLFRRLLAFGGWMTLNNILKPLMLYLGRIMLAILITAEAVAYFSTPHDIIIRLLLIPLVLANALLPTFTGYFHWGHRSAALLYTKSMRYTLLIMLPITLIIYLLARPVLGWWIDETFANNSYRVAELLAIGAFISSLTHISQVLIQAYGRPDLIAKLAVVELIIYIPCIWWLIGGWGMEGAAIAWIVHATISFIASTLIAKKCLDRSLATGWIDANNSVSPLRSIMLNK